MDKRVKIAFAAGISIFIIVFIVINILIKKYEKDTMAHPGIRTPVSRAAAPSEGDNGNKEAVITDIEALPPLPEGDPST